ncbi:MAG: hypothetical protein N2C14_00280, partial [Planctomycetales bacterium]
PPPRSKETHCVGCVVGFRPVLCVDAVISMALEGEATWASLIDISCRGARRNRSIPGDAFGAAEGKTLAWFTLLSRTTSPRTSDGILL